MDHLVMGERQDKVLAVCVEHAEGQFSVVLVPEIGIALHISQEIVHPAHIPLIIKAQAAFLHISRDLRPGGGFLCNQDRSVCLFHGIQNSDALRTPQLPGFRGRRTYWQPILRRSFRNPDTAWRPPRPYGSRRRGTPSPKNRALEIRKLDTLGSSVIVDQRAPVGMGALAADPVCSYTAGAVKGGQAMGVPAGNGPGPSLRSRRSPLCAYGP